MQTSRRSILSAGLVTGSAAVAGTLSFPDTRATAASPALAVDPFTLGVASGDPDSDSFVHLDPARAVAARRRRAGRDADRAATGSSGRSPRDERFRHVVALRYRDRRA